MKSAPPNLLWSKTIIDILDALPPDVSSAFSYLGPANSVLHVAKGESNSMVARGLYGGPAVAPEPAASRYASGAHKRVRLMNPTGASVVMVFHTNIIFAGLATPSTAVSTAYAYMIQNEDGDRRRLYGDGIAISIPNVVLSARTSFPLDRQKLIRADWTHSSEKFPGISVIHKDLSKTHTICPELYPSAEGDGTNLIIPGIQTAEDVGSTLTLLARLLRTCAAS